jgi:hypothetical protein
MAVYDVHSNKDLSFLRSVIVGFLAKINGMSWINQVGPNIEDKKYIDIPFYMSTTGSERYLNDSFLNTFDYDPANQYSETVYNQIPRGIVELEGISIDSQSVVNKYVRTDHIVQEDDGTLNTYNSETFFIPLLINLNVSILVDTILDQLKASEVIFKGFYKSLPFNIEYQNNMIPCYAIFPEDVTREQTLEYSFEDKKEFKLSFAIEIKCSMPVYKEEHISIMGQTGDCGRFFVGDKMDKIISTGYVASSDVSGPTPLVTNTGIPGASGQLGFINEVKN